MAPAAGFQLLAEPIAAFRLALGCRRDWVRHVGLVVICAFQQRVTLKLGIDIGDEVEVGELQQLDGLHQLRRHHQRLALADLKSLRKRHDFNSKLVQFLLISVLAALYSRGAVKAVNGPVNQPLTAGIRRPDRAAARPDC